MKTPFQFTPDKIAEEMAHYQEKFLEGINTLKDIDNFDYGVTPKQEVWRDGKVVLYRFESDAKLKSKLPLLICYALVNRPYMVDLQEDKSLVRQLLALGHDVYILDWGYPDRSDRFLTLEDYIERYIDGAVTALTEQLDIPAVNLLGICQGGVLSLCYTSLHPDKVQNLITMVTPVDFHTEDNMLSNWTRDIDVDLMVDTVGNISADTMNFSYMMLKPWRLFVQKYVGVFDLMDNKKSMEDFLRMEKWIFDSPAQAGETFREFVKLFYQQNAFMNGGLQIGDQHVELENITMPVLNIFAQQDHLVPPSASQPLGGLIGSEDYSELSFKGGHIGIYVSSRAQKEVPSAIHDWLLKREPATTKHKRDVKK